MRFYLSFFVILNLLGVGSCVLPPSQNAPKYLNQKEFDLLTEVTEAKNLAKSGRLDSAELLYRKIIRKNPKQVVALNDLSFLLMMENRIDEAHNLLAQVIAIEPRFVPGRMNYARLLLLQEQYDRAIQEYFAVENILQNYSTSELIEINGEALPPQFVDVVYRLIASAYYLKGEYDNAVCYSALSATRLLVPSEMDLHLRLLLSLEMNKVATDFGYSIISLEGQEIPNIIHFDYALALSAIDENEKAKLVLNSVLEKGGIGQTEMAAARLLQYALETNESNSLIIKENYIENNNKDCALKNFDLEQYWPYNTKIKILRAQNNVCEKNASD